MKNSTKISMLGGDLRQLVVARELSLRYDNIKLWGISGEKSRDMDGVKFCDDLTDALSGADAVILPLPVSADGVRLNCPSFDSEERPKLSWISDAIHDGVRVIGGRMPASFCERCESKGIKIFDYFESEDFQIKNAYTTAEAALSIAMSTLDRNIRGAHIAITGYGRIARHLCDLLRLLGAEVTIAARRESDLAWAQSYGCDTIRISAGTPWNEALKHGYDVIYNTVPYWLFEREFLIECDKNTFIVDLASAPGGVDIKAARELGSNVSWATSLPGKYAPRSAGEIIAECVDKIIREGAGK